MAEVDDLYIMGIHEAEICRLTLQHEVITESTGTLIFAPVDLSHPGLRILDSATADGKWLADLRDCIQKEHEYIGTDITDGMFPKNVPEGMKLQVQDILNAWPSEWRGSFDYIHQRLGLAGIGKHPISDVVARECELLRPGGWIELVELDISERNMCPAVEKLYSVIRNMFEVMGCGWNFCSTLRTALEEAGLEDVDDQLIEVQLGASARTPELGAKGIKSLQLAAQGFADVADKMPLGLSKTELQAVARELQEELENQGAYYLLRVVYGRKPAKVNPYAVPTYIPKQAHQPSPRLYSTLVKDTTVDVASHALSLLGPVKPGSIIHDNGCGCLEATKAFLKIPQAANITIAATDSDVSMVEHAKDISRAQNWRKVTVSNMPAEALTFPDNHFSQSISNILIFMTENDGVDCSKEIYRTLKPGRKAAVTAWATMPHSELVEGVNHMLRGKDSSLMFSMPKQWWKAFHL